MHILDQDEPYSANGNPLDNVEEVLSAHDWSFSRLTDNELIVQITGKNCDYRLFFIWQRDMNALQFCCQYDLYVPDHRPQDSAASTLMAINEKLWMGHFDIPQETGAPTFRQTLLVPENTDKYAENDNIHTLIDIGMAQCERYFTAFYMLSDKHEQQPAAAAGVNTDQAMSLALMETMGES